MLQTVIPKTIRPLELAKQQAHLTGNLPLESMKRLTAHTCNMQGELNVSLDLGKDEAGFYYIQGKIKGNLPLLCQRCLQLCSHNLDAEFLLSPVNTDIQAKALPDKYEPILLNENTIDVIEMIEEEIVLSLPLTILHENENCYSLNKNHGNFE